MFPASRFSILSAAGDRGGCRRLHAGYGRSAALRAARSQQLFPQPHGLASVGRREPSPGGICASTRHSTKARSMDRTSASFRWQRSPKNCTTRATLPSKCRKFWRAGSSGSISFARRAMGETGAAKEWSSNAAFPRRRRTIRRDCARRRWAIFTTSCRWDSAGCRATPSKFHPRIAGPSWRTSEPCN